MNTRTFDAYPGLYLHANQASREAQRLYFGLLAGEYVALILAALLGSEIFSGPQYSILYAVAVFIALGIMLIRSINRPEQRWYAARALAESVKTATWRYMMHAEPFAFPFAEEATPVRAKKEFRNYLLSIVRSNKFVGANLSGLQADKDQITEIMNSQRQNTLEQRKQYYYEVRIKDQRSWYAKRAATHKRHFNISIYISIIVYVVAIAAILERIATATAREIPTEAILLIASAVIGWTQAKKYSELASTYTLTAHEIGIAATLIEEINDEMTFASYVNETELVFSREHTQWVARKE